MADRLTLLRSSRREQRFVPGTPKRPQRVQPPSGTSPPYSSRTPSDVQPISGAAATARWGLDRPVWEQYIIYVVNILRGDFGNSFLTKRPVLTDIVQFLPATIELAISSLLFATVLGIPCLTLRENTERPITVTHGTNRVIGSAPDKIISEAMMAIESARSTVAPPPLWDGHASERILAVIRQRVK